MTTLYLLIFRALGVLLALASVLFSGTRLWRIPCAIDDFMDRFLTHEVAQRVGVVCWECYQLAPAWFDFEIDCADHRCGTCEACLGVECSCEEDAGFQESTYYDEARIDLHNGFITLEHAVEFAISTGDLTFQEGLALISHVTVVNR